MSHTRVVRYLAMGAVVALAVAGSGLAKPPPKNSVSISGPTSVKLGTNFKFKVTGYIVSPANKVAVFEDSQKCSKKQLTELNRFSSSEIDQFFPHVPGHFSTTEHLHAVVAGSHYLCAYVFERKAQINDPHTTYAYASQKWTNHH